MKHENAVACLVAGTIITVSLFCLIGNMDGNTKKVREVCLKEKHAPLACGVIP